MAAWKEAEAEYDRQTKERELFEGQMKECVKFVRDARRLTNKGIPEEGVNPEDLGIVKQLISKAMLTKGPDGRRITVEIRMVEQIKIFFDWWDMFVPEVILVEKGKEGIWMKQGICSGCITTLTSRRRRWYGTL